MDRQQVPLEQVGVAGFRHNFHSGEEVFVTD
jgi:hypothetical protein